MEFGMVLEENINIKSPARYCCDHSIVINLAPQFRINEIVPQVVSLSTSVDL